MSGALDLLLILGLLAAGAAALCALPWTDQDILHVHRAAVCLTRRGLRRAGH